MISDVFDVIETNADEVAVVYINDKIHALITPNERKLYFKGFVKIHVERFNLNTGLAVEYRLARQLLMHPSGVIVEAAKHAVVGRVVPEGQVGLLYVDVEIAADLKPGLHAYFSIYRDVSIKLVDMRVQTLDVQGQEILTRDKVALRLKELETLERVTEKVDNLSVYGGLDSVMDGLVQLKK